MQTDRSRMTSVAILAAVLLVGSACSGPRRKIEVTMKELPGDVAIGKKKPPDTSPTTSPSGVNTEPVGFPPFLQPPPRLQPFPGERSSFSGVGTPIGVPPTAACGTAG